MKLIDNKHQFWKFWSVRLSFASGVISATALGIIAAYAFLPADFLPDIHAGVKRTISYSALGAAGLTAFLGAIARGVDQPKLREPE